MQNRRMWFVADALLQSSFAEADNYPHCDRVLISGDPAEGIASCCERHSNILLMLPSSDLTGLPRPWHRSMRARLIKRLSVPVWTLGRVNVGESTSAVHRHIGVWLGDPEEGLSHLQQAALYASETGGTLHLLHVVDEINEGSLIKPLTSAGPMGEESANAWLREIADSLNPSCRIEVHVAQGHVGRELPRLLRRSGSNMLMASHQSVVQSGWLGPAINPISSKMRHQPCLCAVPRPVRKPVSGEGGRCFSCISCGEIEAIHSSNRERLRPGSGVGLTGP
jgi:hypothetical protein